jgi:DNA primase
MIPQAFIQDLLHRVDVVDVVDRYVKLKRAGANFVACCPFHSEKTPSFTVSQVKQFYHCFGCGAHGTAISFMMEYSGLGFVEAVKDLAQSVGMQVPEAERSEHSQRRVEQSEDLHAVLLAAAHFYRSQLKESQRAIDYLKARGLSGEIAKRFGIGYAPDGWQNLAAAFPDYNAKALAAAGLVKQSEEGRRYDLFRDRIMFPIVDVRGNVIGFGGRVLDSGEPKYLNSPETPVFEKGRELYGLYQARRAIRDAGRVLVVEGYMDVVALAQHEVGYSVAALGTATSGVHVQKLLRQVDEVVFCFDGDAAGRRAAWRALEVSLSELVDGKQVRFLFLPQGDDPDSYVRAHGNEAFEKLVDSAVPLSHFLLDELSSRVDDVSTPEGRAKLLHDAKPLVKQVAAPLLSLLLRKSLAERTGVSQQELDGHFQIKSHPAAVRAPAKTLREGPKSLTSKLILRLMAEGSLAQLADPAVIQGGRQVAEIDQRELEALIFQLGVLRSGEVVSNWVEYTRGTGWEQVFAAVEQDFMSFDQMGLDELQPEFSDFWVRLQDEIGKRLKLLELHAKPPVKI